MNRFFIALAVVVSTLSVPVLAFPVTYNVTGAFSTPSSSGTLGAGLASALGHPSTYEATFTFDSDSLNVSNSGNFWVTAGQAEVKIDGTTLFTVDSDPSSLHLAIADGTTYTLLEFQAAKRGSDVIAGFVGDGGHDGEVFTLQFQLPLGSVDTQHVPVTNFASAATLKAVSLTYYNISPNFTASTASASDFQHANFNVTTPVPEPAEWIMMTVGLLVAASFSRRRLALSA